MFVFLCELKTKKVSHSSKQVEAAKLLAEFRHPSKVVDS